MADNSWQQRHWQQRRIFRVVGGLWTAEDDYIMAHYRTSSMGMAGKKVVFSVATSVCVWGDDAGQKLATAAMAAAPNIQGRRSVFIPKMLPAVIIKSYGS